MVIKPPPHLKHAATLLCNLSLMACFAAINVSQGTVATYARCGGIFNTYLTANFLPGNLPVKKNVNRLRFDRIMAMSLWPRFLAHPVDMSGHFAAHVLCIHIHMVVCSVNVPSYGCGDGRGAVRRCNALCERTLTSTPAYQYPPCSMWRHKWTRVIWRWAQWTEFLTCHS